MSAGRTSILERSPCFAAGKGKEEPPQLKFYPRNIHKFPPTHEYYTIIAFIFPPTQLIKYMGEKKYLPVFAFVG